ncbi:unnamed protein product [Parnassius mnemosyne]|uniref:Uncharacterized protein n=1 Tax=Parnassius mnemosyne TaxID=213953 RepID=A0AAV1K611_9NEOP
MPASSIDLFHMQDAKNNFNAMRPAPIYSDPTNELMGHCQNIHISRNCYYGYHDAKTSENIYDGTDSEMKEIQPELGPSQKNPKKRCADSCAYPQSKRQREEVQRKKNLEPETTENSRLDTSAEDLMENLYWNIHGGHMFQLCCVSD